MSLIRLGCVESTGKRYVDHLARDKREARGSDVGQKTAKCQRPEPAASFTNVHQSSDSDDDPE